MYCRNSNLCLFDEQAVQSDIIKHNISQLQPLNQGEKDGTIEFVIPKLVDQYIDFDYFQLKVKLKLLQANGKDIEDAHKVGMNNLPIATLFRDVALYLNDVLVEGGQMDYPYKAYFQTMTQFHPAAQSSHMVTQGWYKDEARKFDDATNKGFVWRSKLTKESKECELMGPLRLDFFNQSRYLLGDTKLRLKLTLNNPTFLLNAFGSVSDFKIDIIDIKLLYRRVELNPSVVSGHMTGLMKQNAQYPILHTKIVNHSIAKGHMSFNKADLFPGSNPRMIMVGMLDTEAFNGNIKKNPFNFQHFDLRDIVLYVDSHAYPTVAYKPDFANSHYTRSYYDFMSVLSYANKDDTNGLTYKEYGNGYTLYAFDLTPDADITTAHRHAKHPGNISINISWKNPLPTTVTLIIYAVCDSKVEIGRLDQIIPAYNR